jgi:hypothetical protein
MGRPTKHKQWCQAVAIGVTKLTPEVVKKLKEAFAIDCTVVEACFYAEICAKTYYNWINKNPELLHEFERMKNTLPLKAKHNIAARIHTGDVGLSERYLSKKQPDQYGDKIKIEHSSEISEGLPTHPEDMEATKKYYAELRSNRLKRSREQAIKDGELDENGIFIKKTTGL